MLTLAGDRYSIEYDKCICLPESSDYFLNKKTPIKKEYKLKALLSIDKTTQKVVNDLEYDTRFKPIAGDGRERVLAIYE